MLRAIETKPSRTLIEDETTFQVKIVRANDEIVSLGKSTPAFNDIYREKSHLGQAQARVIDYGYSASQAKDR